MFKYFSSRSYLYSDLQCLGDIFQWYDKKVIFLDRWFLLIGVILQLLQSFESWISDNIVLTLPMLTLLSSWVQGRKDFWKPSKLCHIVIHCIVLANYSHTQVKVHGTVRPRNGPITGPFFVPSIYQHFKAWKPVMVPLFLLFIRARYNEPVIIYTGPLSRARYNEPVTGPL